VEKNSKKKTKRGKTFAGGNNLQSSLLGKKNKSILAGGGKTGKSSLYASGFTDTSHRGTDVEIRV
jgi:hypothetical protein